MVTWRGRRVEGEWGLREDGDKVSFQGVENVLNLAYGDACPLCKYAGKHLIVHFKRGDFKVH